MRIFHSPASASHNSPKFFRRGKLIDAPESGARYALLLTALQEAGYAPVDADDAGLAPIAAIHTDDYLSFLKTAWARRAELDADAEELLTTQFARAADASRRATGCSASSATTPPTLRRRSAPTRGAPSTARRRPRSLRRTQHSSTAPPTRCAARPAITPSPIAPAASATSTTPPSLLSACARAPAQRVAILDVDVHHGNGTQGIFYERAEVLTVSIHADSVELLPVLRRLCRRDRPRRGARLQSQSAVAARLRRRAVLAARSARALARIRAFGPAALVVALGLDASEHDPLGVFNVTTEGFGEIARRVATLGCRRR